MFSNPKIINIYIWFLISTDSIYVQNYLNWYIMR